MTINLEDLYLVPPDEWPEMTEADKRLMLEVNEATLQINRESPVPSKETCENIRALFNRDDVLALAQKIYFTYAGKRPALVGPFFCEILPKGNA